MNSLFSFPLLLKAFHWLVKKKVLDFRCTEIWHSFSPGLMPRWVSVGLKELVEVEGGGRKKREASEIKTK